jgi:amidase
MVAMTSMDTKKSQLSFFLFSSLLLILLATLFSGAQAIKGRGRLSSLREATVQDIQHAFKQNQLSSRKLVEFYLQEIERLNPTLKGVIEVNPDARF